MLGSLETFGIEFKTDEVAAGIEAGDGGSARSHTTVKHQLSGIGVGFDQVFKQRQWLLGVVDSVGLGRYMQHAAGIAEAGILGNGSSEVPARVGIVAGLASALVRLALLKLRMVRWGAVAEHQDVLVCPQRRALGIQEACGPRLLPDPFVPKSREVAHTEHLVKGTPGRENDCALGLDDPLVFGPQSLQVNNRVPGIGGDAVGRVRKNHVHAESGEELHTLKAIGMVDAIDRKIGLWQAIEFAIVHEVRQVKDLETQCVAFWLYTPRRAVVWNSHFGRNAEHGSCRGNSGKGPERLAPCGIIGMANVSPALFSLLGQLIITDKHFAVPLFRSALCRVYDLDRRNQPASEQPSHFGVIVQEKQKPAADFV